MPSFLVWTALKFGLNCPHLEILKNEFGINRPHSVWIALRMKCPQFLVLNCPHFWMLSFNWCLSVVFLVCFSCFLVSRCSSDCRSRFDLVSIFPVAFNSFFKALNLEFFFILWCELPSYLVGTALSFSMNCPQAEMPSLLMLHTKIQAQFSMNCPLI